MKQISISDAEWQVMNIIWDGQPLTSQEIVARLSDQADWATATIKTMLHRLVKKRFLHSSNRANGTTLGPGLDKPGDAHWFGARKFLQPAISFYLIYTGGRSSDVVRQQEAVIESDEV